MPSMSPRLVLFVATLLLLLGPRVRGQELVPEGMRQVRLNGHLFTLPEGFNVELAAGADIAPRPITASLDEQGRLYVADSSGTNDPVKVQLEQRPHRILRLEDTDGDGRYDRESIFADQLMFPEGTLWHDGALYVAAPPSIWRLRDTDGDGRADERTEWYAGETLTGCANDLHGPYLGRDGWIYWCKGAFAEQTHEVQGRPWTTKASHIFRCRPDGSLREPVMTGGMDNPVDTVFTSTGERVFTTTFLQHPGGGRRDGLIHAIYGGVYGKDHAPVHDHPWTSPDLMPVLSHLGPAAPCGLACYDATVFGEDFRDNLFACQFNLRRVSRHQLVIDGAGLRAIDSDFLVSDNVDFHPTDVLEDADGSLLVVDTGGWYKLCCPTSQFHKPDVLGAIYRVRKLGAKPPADARGLALDWDSAATAELTRRLADERPAVRTRAAGAIASRADGVESLRALLKDDVTAATRAEAVWASARLASSEARAIARDALSDPDARVRQVAAHVVSLWRDKGALDGALTALTDSSLAVRRVAAEALGRIGDPRATSALIELAQSSDRSLHHSATYALMELADVEALRGALTHSAAEVRRAALTALDQMTVGRPVPLRDGGGLQVEELLRALGDADAGVRNTAWWIVERHAEWSPQLVGPLRRQLVETSAEGREDLVRRLARLARDEAMQGLLAETVADKTLSRAARAAALQAMAQAAPAETPAAWSVVVAESLAEPAGALAEEAVEAARALVAVKSPARQLVEGLASLAEDTRRGAELRLSAAAAIPNQQWAPDAATFALLVEHLQAERPVQQRTLAAEGLARARLDKSQLLALAGRLTSCGPLELERTLDAFPQSQDEEIGLAVVGALVRLADSGILRGDSVRARLAKHGPRVQAAVDELCGLLDADLQRKQERLEVLFAAVPTGDVRRGQAVFHRAKSACSACHAVGYAGGRVGPDLTRIGTIRTERDLLESIVFPSQSIARGYEPIAISTESGETIQGLVREETSDSYFLITGPNQERRVAKSDIERIRPGTVSVMPAGLDQQLTPAELADLVAFLKACR